MRRYGRFSVRGSEAHTFSTDVKRIMGMCIVMRAEHMMWSDKIEYWAMSEHFRPVDEGEMCPEYRWIVSEDGSISCEESTGPLTYALNV